MNGKNKYLPFVDRERTTLKVCPNMCLYAKKAETKFPCFTASHPPI